MNRISKITNFFKFKNKNEHEDASKSSKTKSKSSSIKSFVLNLCSKNQANINYELNCADVEDLSRLFNETDLNIDDNDILKNTEEQNEPRFYYDKPNQPTVSFPQNAQKRKFRENWYKKFSWLEYDVAGDAAFCNICKQYPIIENEKGAFQDNRLQRLA